jgi:hydrogenase expression/formation protein HypE
VRDHPAKLKFMRDPTRGGIAAILNEIAVKRNIGIEIEETALPVSKGVRAMCEMLGYDPLQIANEGKVLMVSGQKETSKVVDIMKRDKLGKQTAVIGRIVDDHPGKVVMKTIAGGRRIIDTLTGDPLPRIC